MSEGQAERNANAPEHGNDIPSSNPVTPFALARMHVQVPQSMSVRLTSTSRLALTDIGALFFTIFLSLAIGFGTTYFSHKNPSNNLLAEFLAWVVFALLTLLIILYFRYKMYTEPTETVTYKLDTTPPLPAEPTGLTQGGPKRDDAGGDGESAPA